MSKFINIIYLGESSALRAVWRHSISEQITKLRPREMLWGGRWEGGSCLGTHVRIKDFKI